MEKNHKKNDEEIKVEFAVNLKVKNKSFKKYDIVSKFRYAITTPQNILSIISQGYAICTSNICRNKNAYCYLDNKNFVSCQIIALDFDNSYKVKKETFMLGKDKYFSFEDAKKDEFLIKYSSFIHTTFNHTDKWNRFRVFFKLEEAITDAAYIKDLTTALISKYKTDKVASSVTQNFFGSWDCEYKYFGKTLTKKVQKEIIAEYITTYEPIMLF